MPRAQQRLDIGRSAVPQPYPDHLRWHPTEEAPLPEIIVLGDDEEPLRCRVCPDGLIVSRCEAELPYMCRVGVEIGEPTGELRREILVEEEPQAPPR